MWVWVEMRWVEFAKTMMTRSKMKQIKMKHIKMKQTIVLCEMKQVKCGGVMRDRDREREDLGVP